VEEKKVTTRALRQREAAFCPGSSGAPEMSRLEPLAEHRAGWFSRLVGRFAKRRFGKVPSPLGVLGRHGALLAANVGFELGLERARRVEAKLKDLAAIRVATLIGCPF
jgi:hypothetical protein